MKLLIGGSPCTHWSIAQTKNRETEASGIGWELLLNYRIARDKYQPDYFLYENNKSMSSAIRAQITAELGVEPVLINSALVSAQNRQRLYWAGKRNPDGTYSQVPVELPEDRGILLRDILETKGALVVNALESWKSRTVDAHMGKLENNLVPRMNDPNPAKQQYDCIAEPLHVCAIDGEDAVLVDAEKNQTVRRSISDIVEKKGYLQEMFNPYNRAEVSEKAPTLSTGSMVTSSCAVLVVDGAVIKAAAPPMQVNEATKLGYTVIQPGECVDLAMPQSKTRRGRAMKDKTNCLTTSCDFYEYCGTLDAPIYQVRDGMITVKGQEYPIKLRDGCYIIRKLTVRECMRLQTVPETYAFPVSPSQAYKMLSNGWTVDVIAHIMGHFEGLTAEPVEVLSMHDGMSCGHIALGKLGAEIASYHATEIDKFAIQTTQANFPDVVQLGDAFQVREDGWTYAGLTGGASEAAE